MCVLHGDRGILARGIRGLQKDRGFSKAFSTQVTLTCILAARGVCTRPRIIQSRVKMYALQKKKYHQGSKKKKRITLKPISVT